MKRNRFIVAWILVLISIPVSFLFQSCKKDSRMGTVASVPPIEDRSPAGNHLQRGQHLCDPRDGWKNIEPEAAGMDSNALERAARYAFEPWGADAEDRTGFRTDALIVIRHGCLVFERYARGYSASTPHPAWSITGSFVNALSGIAVKEGLFQLNDSAGRYYPLLSAPGKNRILIKHLLEMSSGLYWDEGDETSALHSSLVSMLYASGHEDMGAYASSFPVIHSPGNNWYYSGGNMNMLMALLKNRLGSGAYGEYPWKHLFNPIGMKSVTWEMDGSGTFVGSSYIYATARDFARFAYLYLNDGVWAGMRLLPEGWVRYSTTMVESYYTTPLRPDMIEYNPGVSFFLNLGDPYREVERPWPAAPPDTFAATGRRGQFLIIIPSLDLVIVRLGDDRDASFDKNRFLGRVVRSVIEGRDSSRKEWER